MSKFTFIVVLGCDQGESDLSQFSTVSPFFWVKTCLIFPTKDAKYMKIQCMLSAPGFYQEHLVSRNTHILVQVIMQFMYVSTIQLTCQRKTFDDAKDSMHFMLVWLVEA